MKERLVTVPGDATDVEILCSAWSAASPISLMNEIFILSLISVSTESIYSSLSFGTLTLLSKP